MVSEITYTMLIGKGKICEKIVGKYSDWYSALMLVVNNELPLFRNNNIVNLGAWLNLMFVILASVSKPANSQ